MFLTGVWGGIFPFEVSTGIYVELGGYGRASGDGARAVFDNLRIENVLPCTQVAPIGITTTLAETGNSATVTIPLSPGGPGQGSATTGLAMPALPPGITFTMQALIADPATGIGGSVTNGIEIFVQ